MKISEKLSEIKRKEGELQRLISSREQIVDESFRESTTVTADMSAEQIDTLKRKFKEDKTNRFEECTRQINSMVSEILTAKNQINKKNLANGIDSKLLEIKYIRLELSRLMKFIGKRDYLSNSSKDSLDYNNMIKQLEDRKSKLDSEIQFINWNTEF